MFDPTQGEGTMTRRLWLGLLALVSGGLMASSVHPLTLSAQQATDRFRVMVTEIHGLQGADKKFDERATVFEDVTRTGGA